MDPSNTKESTTTELVESKSALSNYVDWKVVFFIGLFILVLVNVLLLLFYNFLRKNIQDDLFLNIYSIIAVLIVINFVLGLYTITRYYYKMKNMGSKGQPGIRGKVGRQGKNAECNIYKKKNYKMSTNKIPNDLRETIKLPNLGSSHKQKPNQGWHTCFSEKSIGPDDTIQRVPDLPYKIIGSSTCYNKSKCHKVDNITPPNNKPINGAIINYNKDSINALQFTYDSNIIPKKDHNNNSLLTIDEMCKSLAKPFSSEEELMKNPDKYLINKENHPIKELAFTKSELDQLYRPGPTSDNNSYLNYVCKYPDFLKPYNIDYIVFTNDQIKINKGSEVLIESNNKDKYMLLGTQLLKSPKDLFIEGYYPTVTCKPCNFDKNRNEFVSVCNNKNKEKCLDYGCIYGKKNMKCSFNSEDECKSQGCKWDGTKKSGNCLIPNKCGGGKVGNTEVPGSKTSNFSCPPYSAIYKIETFSSLDNNNDPGSLEGVKFYCRDIESGNDVMILNEEGVMEYSASFGNTINDGANSLDANFNNIHKQEVKCGINIDEYKNPETGIKKQSPGFISECGLLYNDNNINGLIVNSCNYYYQ